MAEWRSSATTPKDIASQDWSGANKPDRLLEMLHGKEESRLNAVSVIKHAARRCQGGLHPITGSRQRF
jgi:hypothetical protein